MLTSSVPAVANDYVTVIDDASGFEAFLCRFRMQGKLPAEAIMITTDDYVIGFGRRCTHMGCHLVAKTAADLSRQLPMSDGLLRCSCHASCFDLHASGLLVMGPATDWLPTLKLTPIVDPKTGATTSVRIDGWNTTQSVSYGIPYGGTTANPPNS